MKKHLCFFFTFVILIGFITGCANNEKKIASPVANHKELDLIEKKYHDKQADSTVRRQLEKDISKEGPQTSSESEIGHPEENSASVASVEEEDEVNPSELADNIPTYHVNIRKGFMAQQRLVEVKLETDNPENYQVIVWNQELHYRKKVKLFVGIINSVDDDKIVRSIQVNEK